MLSFKLTLNCFSIYSAHETVNGSWNVRKPIFNLDRTAQEIPLNENIQHSSCKGNSPDPKGINSI